MKSVDGRAIISYVSYLSERGWSDDPKVWNFSSVHKFCVQKNILLILSYDCFKKNCLTCGIEIIQIMKICLRQFSCSKLKEPVKWQEQLKSNYVILLWMEGQDEFIRKNKKTRKSEWKNRSQNWHKTWNVKPLWCSYVDIRHKCKYIGKTGKR